MPLDTGSTVSGRYVLGAVLGRGGAADVYRTHDTLLSRDVAVKVLRDTAEDATDRARFVAEARTVANLTHPGLVTVLDAGITTEQPFLVMELVEGETLGARIARGALPATEVERIGVRLAAAVAYAHERDIVHRDVKPGNVLLGTPGSAGSPTGTVKLADFGIARLIGDTVRHTQTGHAIGTAAYLAPEQVLGEALTTAVDVYSLGLVLLEALTGERAFSGPPTEAALARLARDPEVPDTLPDSWCVLLRAMTARQPADRPTAADVVMRLTQPDSLGPDSTDPGGTTAVLTDLTALATPAAQPRSSTAAAIGRRVRDAPPQHQVLAGVAALLLLLLVVAAIASGRSGAGDTPSDLRPPAGVPNGLQGPLKGLHDAVAGAHR